MCLFQSLYLYILIPPGLRIYTGAEFLYLQAPEMSFSFFLHCFSLRSVDLQWTVFSQPGEKGCTSGLSALGHVSCPLFSLGSPVSAVICQHLRSWSSQNKKVQCTVAPQPVLSQERQVNFIQLLYK